MIPVLRFFHDMSSTIHVYNTGSAWRCGMLFFDDCLFRYPIAVAMEKNRGYIQKLVWKRWFRKMFVEVYT